MTEKHEMEKYDWNDFELALLLAITVIFCFCLGYYIGR